MATHWARVKLAQGQSAAAHWELSHSTPEARLVVGSGVKAGWIVNGPEIVDVHFQFAWDGQALWLAPMAGPVELDGRVVSEWAQLGSQHEICFGAGRMRVETSDSPPAQRQSEPDDPPTWDDGPTSVYSDEIRITAEETRMANLEAIEARRDVAAPRLGGMAGTPPTGLPSSQQGAQQSPLPPSAALAGLPDYSSGELSETEHGRFRAPPPPRTSVAPAPSAGVPLRTWILLAITLAMAGVALGLTISNKRRRATAQRMAIQADNRRQELLAREEAAKVRAAIDERMRRSAAAEQALLQEALPAIEGAVGLAVEEALANAAADADADAIAAKTKRRIVERIAVNAVVSNHLPTALAHYLYLAGEFPDDRTYQAMLPILRAKLRCRDGQLPDGRPCR